jgi:formylglycine-generating enzyme required for sulfatase activity
MTRESYLHHVFLSYSRKDNDAMCRVRDDLRAEGLIVWTDANLKVGTQQWKDAIQDAIENAGCLVVILSPDAKQSVWVDRELEYARAQRVSIFSVLARGDASSAIPIEVVSDQWADIRTNYAWGFQELVGAVCAHLGVEGLSAQREREAQEEARREQGAAEQARREAEERRQQEAAERARREAEARPRLREEAARTHQQAQAARVTAKPAAPAPRALPSWVSGVGVGVGMALCVGAVIGVRALSGAFGGGSGPTPIPLPTPDAAASQLAMEGVLSNAEWAPVAQDFDGVPMALVPAGCFMMGSNEYSNEQPIHEVCFEEPFWIDVYEVTNGQYGSPGQWSGDNLPREAVDWFDAVAHCESRGARLPTEAEWEYAARGPDGLVYPWGNEFVSDYAVWNTSHTANVGSRPGGVSWVGAYDLSGNVWEWVADWYGTYSSEAQVNPTGPGSGDYRLLRGGSWDSIGYPYVLRGAIRDFFDPDITYNTYGFRCALSQ